MRQRRLTNREKAIKYRRWAGEAQAEIDRYRATGFESCAILAARDVEKFNALAEQFEKLAGMERGDAR